VAALRREYDVEYSLLPQQLFVATQIITMM
jgi:hypothetical protein